MTDADLTLANRLHGVRQNSVQLITTRPKLQGARYTESGTGPAATTATLIERKPSRRRGLSALLLPPLASESYVPLTETKT